MVVTSHTYILNQQDIMMNFRNEIPLLIACLMYFCIYTFFFLFILNNLIC